MLNKERYLDSAKRYKHIMDYNDNFRSYLITSLHGENIECPSHRFEIWQNQITDFEKQALFIDEKKVAAYREIVQEIVIIYHQIIQCIVDEKLKFQNEIKQTPEDDE